MAASKTAFPRTMTKGKFAGQTFKTIGEYQKALRNGGPKKRKPAAKMRKSPAKPTRVTSAKRGVVPTTVTSITIDFSLLGQQFQIDGLNDALVDQALREADQIVGVLSRILKLKKG